MARFVAGSSKRSKIALSSQRGDTASATVFIGLNAPLPMFTFYWSTLSSFNTISDVHKESQINIAVLQSRISQLYPVLHDAVRAGRKRL